MRRGSLLQLGALAIGIAPFTMWGAIIQGPIAGKTATGAGPDDVDTATTINVTFQTFCPWIVAGAAAYAGSNFIFAGQGVASIYNSVDPGDFTISQYNPWVVNSNATNNNMNRPDGGTYNRGVTNQDAGGANIIISYTPKNAGDPDKVNFVQAFIESDNGGAFSNGTIDASGASPYYNNRGISGTGTTLRTGTIPLRPNSTTPAWMLDVPYDCENGQAGVSNADCTGGVDDSLTSQTLYFQSFIEQDKVINGTNYQVLFGGVQWGYSLTIVETPEPSSLLLAGSALLAAAGLLRRFSASQSGPSCPPRRSDENPCLDSGKSA
jgi:hypothetical protein